MPSTTQHSTDVQLKSSVIDELKWAPNLDDTQIGVSVNAGAVTLFGEVSTYLEKINAQKAVQRVHGVHGIAQEMTVRTPGVSGGVSDTDLARDAADAVATDVAVPEGSVEVAVAEHVVTLTGKVTWNFQREAAEHAVRRLRGIHDIHNDIVLEPTASSVGIKEAISGALSRHAAVDAHHCVVTTTADGSVTLTGHVSSWAVRDQAEHVAWAAPGVRHVINQLSVR